jgi:hypothetical protein
MSDSSSNAKRQDFSMILDTQGSLAGERSCLSSSWVTPAYYRIPIQGYLIFEDQPTRTACKLSIARSISAKRMAIIATLSLARFRGSHLQDSECRFTRQVQVITSCFHRSLKASLRLLSIFALMTRLVYWNLSWRHCRQLPVTCG